MANRFDSPKNLSARQRRELNYERITALFIFPIVCWCIILTFAFKMLELID